MHSALITAYIQHIHEHPYLVSYLEALLTDGESGAEFLAQTMTLSTPK